MDLLLFRPRFAYDGLKRQRITEPYVKAKDGFLKPEIWENALVAVARVSPFGYESLFGYESRLKFYIRTQVLYSDSSST